ncbi:hypothetical protein INT46_005777, partial [Mucor plumbeus]
SVYPNSAELVGIPQVDSPSIPDFPDRYFHIRVPYIDSPVNIFSVISASTYAIGMIGSYKKSPKLIKCHKYLLFFDIIITPLTFIECIWASSSEWSKISIPDEPDVPDYFKENMVNFFIMFAVFMGGIVCSTYIQQVYATYVAYKYEKYLLLSGGERKEKE